MSQSVQTVSCVMWTIHVKFTTTITHFTPLGNNVVVGYSFATFPLSPRRRRRSSKSASAPGPSPLHCPHGALEPLTTGARRCLAGLEWGPRSLAWFAHKVPFHFKRAYCIAFDVRQRQSRLLRVTVSCEAFVRVGIAAGRRPQNVAVVADPGALRCLCLGVTYVPITELALSARGEFVRREPERLMMVVGLLVDKRWRVLCTGCQNPRSIRCKCIDFTVFLQCVWQRNKRYDVWRDDAQRLFLKRLDVLIWRFWTSCFQV